MGAFEMGWVGVVWGGWWLPQNWLKKNFLWVEFFQTNITLPWKHHPRSSQVPTHPTTSTINLEIAQTPPNSISTPLQRTIALSKSPSSSSSPPIHLQPQLCTTSRFGFTTNPRHFPQPFTPLSTLSLGPKMQSLWLTIVVYFRRKRARQYHLIPSQFCSWQVTRFRLISYCSSMWLFPLGYHWLGSLSSQFVWWWNPHRA